MYISATVHLLDADSLFPVLLSNERITHVFVQIYTFLDLTINFQLI